MDNPDEGTGRTEFWGRGGKKKRNNLGGFSKAKKRFRAGEGDDQAASTNQRNVGRVFFQDTELFIAPSSTEDHQVRMITLNNPVQYPGWRLYFPKEAFVESSETVKQIKAFEEHIRRNPTVYELQKIQRLSWFSVSLQFLAQDNELSAAWNDIGEHFRNEPKMVLNCLGLAMHSVINKMLKESATSQETSYTKYQCKKKNLQKITARPLCASPATCLADFKHDLYDRLVVVQGYVDSVSSVHSECSWLAYRCNRCWREQTIWQGEFYPTKPLGCRLECNTKRNFTPLRSSPHTKIDCTQSMQLREMKIGHSHLTIAVNLRGDLVNCVGPGNEVTVVGILKMKALETKKPFDHQKQRPSVKSSDFIEALNVIRHTNTGVKYRLETPKDLEMVHTISREANCFKLLVNSLAPDLCGHELQKAAVLISLFGGSGSQVSEEGDLHVLVVGDPGVGKSNLLLSAANVSDLGRFVSGKNNTSVPSMSHNVFLNTSNLLDTESMFSSSTGHFCVDDFDKLLSLQEGLIHNLQTSLVTARNTNACLSFATKKSLLAAANPVNGHYDPAKLVRENVRLNSSLLSLFHLVYVLIDKADKDRDNSISEHIKALHSGLKKGKKVQVKKGTETEVVEIQDEKVELQDRLKVGNNEQIDLLPAILLKKYIGYAKHCTKPLLMKEAAVAIKEFYLELRKETSEMEKFLVTTRQLEGLIRLSQARARVELSSAVKNSHTQDVLELVRHSSRLNINAELEETSAGTSQGNQVKKFIKMLHHRANALGRKVFEFEELKDIASRVGLTCGVTNLVEVINMQGYLLKKGPNLYEVITQ